MQETVEVQAQERFHVSRTSREHGLCHDRVEIGTDKCTFLRNRRDKTCWWKSLVEVVLRWCTILWVRDWFDAVLGPATASG